MFVDLEAEFEGESEEGGLRVLEVLHCSIYGVASCNDDDDDFAMDSWKWCEVGDLFSYSRVLSD